MWSTRPDMPASSVPLDGVVKRIRSVYSNIMWPVYTLGRVYKCDIICIYCMSMYMMRLPRVRIIPRERRGRERADGKSISRNIINNNIITSIIIYQMSIISTVVVAAVPVYDT